MTVSSLRPVELSLDDWWGVSPGAPFFGVPTHSVHLHVWHQPVRYRGPSILSKADRSDICKRQAQRIAATFQRDENKAENGASIVSKVGGEDGG